MVMSALVDFQHANNTTILRLHALVWRVEDLWLLLDESSGLRSLGVEFLKHTLT